MTIRSPNAISEATGRAAHRTSTGTIKPRGRCILPLSAVRSPSMTPFWRPFSALFELQGRRVDAVALPGRLWPVREEMAEVSAAGRTEDLGADHAVAPVALLLDRGLACGGEEGGPAAARVVLRVRLEEQRAAAGAMVGARVEDVVVLTG